MGGSEGSEGGLAPEECGVGTIVWVRRRNGSWWPGRILGQEELSASHLMSPRSGTPVKLLGREDASVDWYNLEKSKRVKAFRCGEFDTCIERAESSHGIPIKKREKYARREDAILHALELEKQFLEEKEQKVGSANKYLVVPKTELPSGNYLNNDESLNHDSFVAKLQHQSRKVGPLETESIDPFYSQKGKNDKHSSWEDDASEATPRMRGLQDFGLRSSQSKRKVDGPVAREITRRHFLVDSHDRAFPGSMQGMEEINNVKSGESFPPLKNRRNQGCLDEELITKRRDRRHPLVQVLQSSAKFSASLPLQSDDGPIPVNMHVENDQILTLPTAEKSSGDNPLDSKNCLDQTECSSDLMQISPVHHRNPGSLVEENVSSGLNEAGESDSSGEVCSDDDPETEDDATLYQASTRRLLSMSKKEGRYVENDGMVTFPDQGYQNTEGNDEAFVSNHVHSQCLDQQSEDTSADLGVSKWNLKGKRNTRNLMKRPVDSMNEMSDHIYLSSMNGGRSYERKRHPLISSRGRAIRAGFYEKYDDFYGNNFIENDLSLQSTRDNSHRYSSMIKGVAEDNKEGSNDDSDEESLVMLPSGWEAGDQFDQYYAGYMDGDIESTWVDIDLKVQASYHGERVPLVSLMSKLNGKAIIGHPVQIEMLNDGSSDSLIARNDLGEDPTSCDGNETPLVWRTGRRTVMQRIPRSHPLPAALNGKEDDSFLYSDPEIKPTFKRPYDIHLDSGIRLAKKTPNSNRPIKYQKKTSKKLSLSNQKVRKLSSFETQLKLGRAHAAGDKLNSKGRSIVDALIKPGSMPMVTCVPVKVVFSRILEAVGRFYFTSKTHQSLASSSPESNHHDPKS